MKQKSKKRSLVAYGKIPLFSLFSRLQVSVLKENNQPK